MFASYQVEQGISPVAASKPVMTGKHLVGGNLPDVPFGLGENRYLFMTLVTFEGCLFRVSVHAAMNRSLCCPFRLGPYRTVISPDQRLLFSVR